MMHKPPPKRPPLILLRRLKKHNLALLPPTPLPLPIPIPHLPAPPHKHNLLLIARIHLPGRRKPIFLRAPLLPVLALLNEASDLDFEVHEEPLCASRALHLLAEFFGDDARGGGLLGDGAGGGCCGGGGGLALCLLAGEAGVPEGGEVVGDVVNGVGGVDFPVAGLGGFGVGVVEEAVLRRVS